jgi:hypothetical protein
MNMHLPEPLLMTQIVSSCLVILSFLNSLLAPLALGLGESYAIWTIMCGNDTN